MPKKNPEKLSSKRYHFDKLDRSIIHWWLGFGYALVRFSQGLLLHPYQTMQIIVEQSLFSWLVLLPTIFLGVLGGTWRLFLIFILEESVAQGLSNQFIYSFLIGWISLFCVFWQILIFYLFFRFKRAQGW